MDARQALAFVARRQGRTAMEASTWRHVMSLELGWMGPGDAKRYVDACIEAGLLRAEGDALALSFDPRRVEVQRGFRPDPSDLPAADAPGPSREGGPPSTAAGHAAAPVGDDVSTSRADAGSGTSDDVPGGNDADEGLFSAWLARVAAARGEDAGETLAAVTALQHATGGLLHAEAALLFLGRDAGLDVRDAAWQALAAIRS